jgi:uncharacterized membrane protein
MANPVTRFAGSMMVVNFHVALFSVWMVEPS